MTLQDTIYLGDLETHGRSLCVQAWASDQDWADYIADLEKTPWPQCRQASLVAWYQGDAPTFPLAFGVEVRRGR